MKLEGIHHITAITGDAPRNVDFYVRVLGLRMVKKTVNQDDPTVYHLFYADEHGSAGVGPDLLRVPERPPGPRRRPGWSTGSRTASPPRTRSTFWEDRLGSEGVATSRVDGGALRFADPEGLEHELVVADVPDAPLRARSTEVPDEHALLGFHAVDAAVANPRKTEALLRDTLGFSDRGDDTWEARGDQRGGLLRLEAASGRGFGGAGTIHHIAWATTLDEHSAWREHVAAAGYRSPRSSIASTSARSTSASRAGSCSSWPRSVPASRRMSRWKRWASVCRCHRTTRSCERRSSRC